MLYFSKISIFTDYLHCMKTDLKYLQQMAGYDNDAIKEMIGLFLIQLNEMGLEFDALVSNKNWHELSRLAHKAKSSALVMGIESMAVEMKELEQLAKEAKDTELYSGYMIRFNETKKQVEEELKTYLEQ